ncbi:MAG: hypothetical protein AMXMBFR64_52470 [Myxococcales bacterium]
MRLYAESSAVLAWLLGEPGGEQVRDLLAAAESVLASDLTLIECDRVLVRGAALGELAESAAMERHGALGAAAAHWHLLRVGVDTVERARRAFPKEPVRTLDALHLASALTAQSIFGEVHMLTLDQRVRENARLLGMTCLPQQS